MAGGLMQLVAYGAQDVYLTGNPQITYFKVVYRRHTNFAMETKKEIFSGNADFGRTSSVRVERFGDLATNMYLRVKLNSVTLGLNDPNLGDRLSVAWVRRLGHNLIKHVTVYIGGAQIDKQYGTWLDIWYELTHHDDQVKGYRAMIGDVDTLTKLRPVTDTTREVIPEYTLYIPLQFWFNRNTGLALPLIALQYHDTRIEFEFEEVRKLVIHSGNVNVDYRSFSMKEVELLINYIYLDAEERRRFAQVGHEYLIEQVQFTGEETINGTGNRITKNTKLNFNHPTKEIIWAVKNGAYNGDGADLRNNRFLTYTNDDSKWETDALDYAAENIARGMISCDAPTNNEVLYAEIRIPAGRNTYVWSYSRDGFDLTITFHLTVPIQSSVLDVFVILNPLTNVHDNSAEPYNLGKFIHRFDVNLQVNEDQTELYGYTVDMKSHSLNLDDVSIPIQDWIDYRTTTVDNVNKYDVTVIQGTNYGVRLDGKGNPVLEGKIQLNSQDRFDTMHGNYFNYVQPYQHHTHTPSDGVNVYSFALHPEQHQPSGTANLSRIDNTMLNLTFADPFRRNKQVPQLPLGRDSKLYIYALSYNVLRIMSGMGGLAYSN